MLLKMFWKMARRKKMATMTAMAITMMRRTDQSLAFVVTEECTFFLSS
jgi:hypothetical protein